MNKKIEIKIFPEVQEQRPSTYIKTDLCDSLTQINKNTFNNILDKLVRFQ